MRDSQLRAMLTHDMSTAQQTDRDRWLQGVAGTHKQHLQQLLPLVSYLLGIVYTIGIVTLD